MPVTVRVPVRDNRATGGKRFPLINDELFAIYGNPWDSGFVGVFTTRSKYIGKEAEITFEAQDPVEQDTLDEWASQIASDDVSTIRKKVDAAAVADEARALQEGNERRIYKISDGS